MKQCEIERETPTGFYQNRLLPSCSPRIASIVGSTHAAVLQCPFVVDVMSHRSRQGKIDLISLNAALDFECSLGTFEGTDDLRTILLDLEGACRPGLSVFGV